MNDHKNQVPIYFKSLELENVRCFAQRQRLDLTDEHGKPVQWILILGDNGVGKTTLLQCLAWMRARYCPCKQWNPRPKTTIDAKLIRLNPR